MDNKEIITDLLIRLYCERITTIVLTFSSKEAQELAIAERQKFLEEALDYDIDFLGFDNIIRSDIIGGMRRFPEKNKDDFEKKWVFDS